MQPVPIPDDMLPQGMPHKRLVVGPPAGVDITDESAPRPVEAVIMEDGFHIRIGISPSDLTALMSRPYIWLVFHSDQVPVFSIVTESEAVR